MTVSQDVARALPLVVERLAINDPMLVVSGHAWSLSIMCPWELNGPNVRVTFETDESDVAAALELLVGQSIVAVDINDDLFDAVFHLTMSLNSAYWLIRGSILGRVVLAE